MWVGDDIPTAREETGCFLWAVQHPSCLGVQADKLAIEVVDKLAIEVTNVQTGVWERRDGRRSESRVWRFVDVDNLVTCDVYEQPLSL